MRTEVGLWIDHRKAVIVSIMGKGEDIRSVISKAELHPSRSGDSPLKGSHESQKVSADDSRQKRLTGKLNIYYDEVVAHISEAQSILIFGPGEAKGQLKKRLAKANLDGHIVGTETVDKMTEPQIAAKVRQHYEDTHTAQ